MSTTPEPLLYDLVGADRRYGIALEDALLRDQLLKTYERHVQTLTFVQLCRYGELLLRNLAAGEQALSGRAIAVWRAAVAKAPSRDKSAQARNNLALALEVGAETEAALLLQAILMQRQALRGLPPRHPNLLGMLAVAAHRLINAAEAFGDETMLDEALSVVRRALRAATRASAPDARQILLNSGLRLAAQPGWLALAEDMARVAKDLCNAAGLTLDQAQAARAVAASIAQAQWSQTSDLRYLAVQIEALRDAVEDRRNSAIGASSFKQGLAVALLDRHERFGQLQDMHAAVALLQEAYAVNNHAGVLNSLVIAQLKRVRCGDIGADYLAEAASLLSSAAEAAVDAETRGCLTWTLGTVHLEAFRAHHGREHLDDAIIQYQTALDLLSVAKRPQIALALSQAYCTAAKADSDPAWLDRAVDIGEAGLEATAVGSPDRWSAQFSLANALQDRFWDGGVRQDSDRAVALLGAARDEAPTPLMRVEAIATLAGYHLERHLADLGEDERGMAEAMARDVAPTTSALAGLSSVAQNNLALTWILSSDDDVITAPWRAVFERMTLAEDGAHARMMPASNWLMRAAAAQDWRDVVRAYGALHAARREIWLANSEPAKRLAVLREFQGFAGLAALAQVRLGAVEAAIAPLEEAQPWMLQSLTDKPQPGDVAPDTLWGAVDEVWRLAATLQGGLLIRETAEGARGAVLPGLTPALAEVWRQSPFDCLDEVSAMLQTALGDEPWPERLLLAPVGALSGLAWPALPLNGGALIDQVELAVTPSVSCLRAPSHQAPLGAEGALFVQVAQPLGYPPLRHAVAEVEQASGLYERPVVLREAEATAVSIQTAATRAKVLHLACHGLSDPDHLQRTRLIAHEPIELGEIGAWRLDGVEVVYLSACETAAHGGGVHDELSSLAAVFLAAGCASAVGAITRVNDVAASLLGRRFHWGMARQGLAPRSALRQAQLWLRDTENHEKLAFLETLDVTVNEAERDLRSKLAATPKGRMNAPRHWAATLFYGLGDAPLSIGAKA
ncbi:CHAT domain-containing protein [Caulobacter segnis]